MSTQYLSTDAASQMSAVRSLHYRSVSGVSEVATAMGGSVLAQADAGDLARIQSAGIVDLTLMSRVGYRGKGAEGFLDEQGIRLPDTPNQAVMQPTGELAVRLSPREFWLLGSLNDRGARVAEMPRLHKETPERCYPLFCEDSHSWFVLAGEHVAQVMAKLCAVDLREKAFPLGAVAQTSVARTNCIVVHHRIRELSCFSILSDATSGEYLLSVLQDAVTEFRGGLCGIEALL